MGFLPALWKVWLSPRAKSSAAQAVFTPQKPLGFGDFNHFPNRCIAVRMDKVLKLALCSVEPKFFLVIKVFIFASNKEIKWNIIVSFNFIPICTVTFLTKMKEATKF